MSKRASIGIILIMIGIGIPLVLFFFQQEDGRLWYKYMRKEFVRELTDKEISTLKALSSEGLRPSDIAYLAETEVADMMYEDKHRLGKKLSYEEFKEAYTKAFWNFLNREMFLLEKIKKIYGENIFTNKNWKITTYESISFQYRYVIGVGVLICFLGINLFIFSIIKKK